ncbi:hypothetical protein CWI39_1196p0010 [Hamiltosporidium magnivora]|uniref:Uncharacterized protein n=1 Tax=Hamiltosporidium magnivora TaxID=148818 RepID=A0A4V2JV14_9MICR|nr:hypothetical protein CWI39_1196p0010 [Hamiltosporidium magnivora]
MRGTLFVVGLISLMIERTTCISYINVGCNTMHILCSVVCSGRSQKKNMLGAKNDNFKDSINDTKIRYCKEKNPYHSPMQRQGKRFCLITTNSMEDSLNFHYIMEPGFRFMKESIFDTIDFLTTEEYIKDINERNKEYLKNKKLDNKFVGKIISNFGSVVKKKMIDFLKNRFSQPINSDKINADFFDDAYLVFKEEIKRFIVEFKRDNEIDLKEAACRDNEKEKIISNILEVMKSKFFLYDCVEKLVYKFYQSLYLKFQKEIYFRFFGKTKEECIEIEKEKNKIYKRLQIMKEKLQFDTELDNIFVPFSIREKHLNFTSFFSLLCEFCAEVRINFKKAKKNKRIFFVTILTDEFQLFKPEFLFAQNSLYFYNFYFDNIKDLFQKYGGENVNLHIIHMSFIDLKDFLFEFLVNYSDDFIYSQNRLSFTEIIHKERESISDFTKSLIQQMSPCCCLWFSFLLEIYRLYLRTEYFKCELTIFAFEISLVSFQEIYNDFLEKLETNKKMFLIGQEEMEACRDFFLKCVLFRIKHLTEKFDKRSILSIDFEIIKE